MQVRKTSGLEQVMAVSDRLPNLITLQVLIHYHICVDAWQRYNRESAASQAAEEWLVKHRLLDWNDDFKCFTSSQKGKALIAHIMGTPLPVEHTTWKVPHREAAE